MRLPATAKLVLASHNAGKLKEMQAMLADLPLQILSAADAGVGDVPETGLTFVENALIKARAACQASGLPALADDSGLIVDALGGAPGLYSARYAGSPTDDAANNAKLLADLRDVPAGQRTARFFAVIVLLRHAADPQPLVCEGSWEGVILEAPRGHNGFGYNPVFLDPRHGLTAAEMEPALKNTLSHRALALQQLKQRLSSLSL
ncbi:non-canonical purine NTP pyrophosphatase, RdgB/HAM1 family [Stenotrophomonas sp. Betaine-02u-21]|jgi:XTP/dITP diphosphohydrolase|uniref:RdgB/HAM1 family non-canonical purine NTP pyrophosphatase n=1 Tax=Stenotrophomonas TaxID=40323 RepID=UPI000C3392DD|nr:MULTISPECIES: RdgB/HAM1 family non-canonical purine NTP pyrophosphatase [unclassified Stenotrophomonas]MDY1032746.1 RdgB/HAM1 family non-canonical purine NTP pyrophosphatase [Stenotrophomonas sp. CFBP8980]PKH75836.1 non-canonical purine NTP pyrophosphatase, RdgB/HAM1 family [Stenotrophomonas sp. Betaine-02u-21]PKH75966.1 non-canonical purine NTP pyrophosphatase, RdgB/HAM1 family [Stenotrophomonas sp. Betaine-02u-23]PKH97762.1 non-canonical purine NTP pyrophosphatase, RdgB/HAM1 family [Stenot